jgi:hypothetical protein
MPRKARGQAPISYSAARGLGYEPGVTRRDPSCVIRVGSRFYVWYTKTSRAKHGYDATVWYATSPNGHVWTEQGEALPRGEPGSWDAQSTFTPGILVWEDRYYLYYTSVAQPFSAQAKTAIGVAVAETPDGPWSRFAGNPVLTAGSGTTWDSHRVDDACPLVRQGRVWLYYKGRQMGLSPRETKMGLAIAEEPLGDYRKDPRNPLISSGHEVLVWHHGDEGGDWGVVTWVQPVGPEGGTIQTSPDGVRFTVRTELTPPRVPGPYRPDAFVDAGSVDRAPRGFSWGICQNDAAQYRPDDWPYLERFDVDLSL